MTQSESPLLIVYQGNLHEIQRLVPVQTDSHAKLRDNGGGSWEELVADDRDEKWLL